jgi:hypothetical protein
MISAVKERDSKMNLFAEDGMRTLVLLLTLAGFVLPAFAAKRVTVAQLEQELAAISGRPDAEVARQLSDWELTERLSTARLDRLETNLSWREGATGTHDPRGRVGVS